MASSLGSRRAADTHAWTAWMRAEQARHDGACAWARGTQAKVAYWDGRYTESAQLAEDGLRYGTADSARVLLTLPRARALARTGQVEDARQALNQAENERTVARAPDLVGGPWDMTAERYHHMAASAQGVLEAPAQTLAEAGQVITLTEAAPAGERHMWAYACARIDSTIAHLQQRELDGAVAMLRPVLDLPADGRTEPMLQQLARIRRLLAQPAFAEAPLARDAQEEIETYRREALPRQISPLQRSARHLMATLSIREHAPRSTSSANGEKAALLVGSESGRYGRLITLLCHSCDVMATAG